MISRAALLTPAGPGGIAVIQLRGLRAAEAVENIFRFQADTAQGGLKLGKIVDEENNVVDEVLLVDNSEQNLFEIHCHGGPRVVQRILMLLRDNGLNIVKWQELVDADSIEQEVTQTLPLARTRKAVLAISHQHPAGLTAWVEGEISSLKKDLIDIHEYYEEATRLLRTYTLTRRLLQPAQIVITGPVNVGKSTLANVLTGRRQSLAADLPGTTRDYTSQLTDINGLPVELIDTAGRRDTDDYLEKMSLEKADKLLVAADLVLLVVSAADDVDEQIDQQLEHIPIEAEVLIVVNKADRVDVPASSYLHISALVGDNLDELRQSIADQLGLSSFNPAQPLVFTDRQVALLTDSLSGELETVLECLRKLRG